jgi:hypothetical protein
MCKWLCVLHWLSFIDIWIQEGNTSCGALRYQYCTWWHPFGNYSTQTLMLLLCLMHGVLKTNWSRKYCPSTLIFWLMFWNANGKDGCSHVMEHLRHLAVTVKWHFRKMYNIFSSYTTTPSHWKSTANKNISGINLLQQQISKLWKKIFFWLAFGLVWRRSFDILQV